MGGASVSTLASVLLLLSSIPIDERSGNFHESDGSAALVSFVGVDSADVVAVAPPDKPPEGAPDLATRRSVSRGGGGTGRDEADDVSRSRDDARASARSVNGCDRRRSGRGPDISSSSRRFRSCS